MSNFYSTKSLGRTWIPPPSSPGLGSPLRHKTTSAGYFASSASPARTPLLESQPFRWSREDMKYTPGSWRANTWWRWSKVHERILLAAIVIVSFWLFGNPFRQSLQARVHFHGSLLPWGQQDAEVELELKNATWQDFAYVTYATNLDYLCNSVMMAESLWRLGAKAERLVLHSEFWSVGSTTVLENGTEVESVEARLLRKARDGFGAVLQPIAVQRLSDDRTWGDSFTKLLAFNQTQYRRVLALDSDSTILQPMDELFLLPSTPVAMPRAYWLEHELFDAITLVTPSETSHERIQKAIEQRGENDFDMDIMNRVFGDSCMVLPHRGYALVTGEFRKQGAGEHAAYLGAESEGWDAKKVLGEAKFVHFSDWPLGKPWVATPREQKDEVKPKCRSEGSMEEDCGDREVWEGLYKDFRARRKTICGPELAGWETETDMEMARLLSDPVPSASPVASARLREA